MRPITMMQSQWKAENQGLILKPKHYKRLTYIQSTGTEYIDTGAILDQTSQIEIKFSLINPDINSSIFGTRNAGVRSLIIMHQETYISVDMNTYSYRLQMPRYNEVDIELSTSKEKMIMNGRTYAPKPIPDFQTDNSAYLFYARNGPAYPPATIKLYSCKIYTNGILVRDFIPSYRVDDGKIGLYDPITDMFYTNTSKTDNFIMGEEVNEPEESVLANELCFNNCKGGYFSTIEDYTLKVVGNEDGAGCVKKGTKIKITNDSSSNPDINEIIVPCDLNNGDIWYPIIGKITRSSGKIERLEPQLCYMPIGTAHIFQEPIECECGLLATALVRR